MENKRNNWQTAPWDIRPSDGIGPLKFGMTLEEVKKLLGWEVEWSEDVTECNRKAVFFKDIPSVSLYFNLTNGSFCGITFFSDDFWASVNGEVLVVAPWRKLVEQLGIQNGGTYITDDRGRHDFYKLRVSVYDESCGDDSGGEENRAVSLAFDDGVTRLFT